MFGGLIPSAPSSRTWFSFLRAVASGNVVARNEFERICIFPGLFTEYSLSFVPYSDWLCLPCGTPQNEEDVLGYLFTTRHKDRRDMKLPAPFEIAQLLNQIMEKMMVRYETGNDRLMHLLTWFHAKRKNFDDAKQAMWHEMQTEPRCALRPGGQDRIKIAVTNLNTPVVAYYGMTLVPIDPFPSVEARLDSRFFDEPCSLTVRLGSPTAYSETLHCTADHPDLLLRELLEFIVVDCCWRIITDNDSPSLLAGVHAGVVSGQESPKKRNKTVRHPGFQVVRAKFKKLPYGFQASKAAIKRALEDVRFRTAPPEGTTFRRDFRRGYNTHGTPADSSPLFTYRETDFGYEFSESC